MGIYISDLEIPKEKAVQIVIIRDDGVCVDEIGNTYGVVSLPSHGRLIDTAWINKVLIDTLEALKKNPKMDKEEMHLISAFHTLGVMVADAPTIIPAEPCNDLAKPNNTIFAVQNTDEDEGLFAAKPIDYMHTPSVEEIIKGDGE